jgi:hypothetical protein
MLGARVAFGGGLAQGERSELGRRQRQALRNGRRRRSRGDALGAKCRVFDGKHDSGRERGRFRGLQCGGLSLRQEIVRRRRAVRLDDVGEIAGPTCVANGIFAVAGLGFGLKL